MTGARLHAQDGIPKRLRRNFIKGRRHRDSVQPSVMPPWSLPPKPLRRYSRPMFDPLVSNLAALLALAPAAVLPLVRPKGRDLGFWAALALAAAGAVAWAASQVTGSWQTNLSATLWVGIAASLVLFLPIAAFHRQAWRLTPLLLGYLLLLGLMAVLFASAAGLPLSQNLSAGWVDTHILVSIASLAFLTVAASAALASFLQVRALKTKRPNSLTRMLPSVTDSERLFERLLLLAELVLGLGVATGMATQYSENGRILAFDHKTLLSLTAFVLIGMLLIGRRVCGVRGQIAARTMLLAYSLVIIGYFGVKFVKQVLLS